MVCFPLQGSCFSRYIWSVSSHGWSQGDERCCGPGGASIHHNAACTHRHCEPLQGRSAKLITHVHNPLIPFHGVAGCCFWSQSQPCPGYSLDKSPTHRRALTDEQCGVQHLTQGPGFEPATFRSVVDLLYPLSYSPPSTHRLNQRIKLVCVLYEIYMGRVRTSKELGDKLELL